MTERKACRILNQPTATQRRFLKPPGDEERLTADIIDLATEFGRYGYRRITALLNRSGWQVNHKRVERVWRREGLKVPLTLTGTAEGGTLLLRRTGKFFTPPLTPWLVQASGGRDAAYATGVDGDRYRGIRLVTSTTKSTPRCVIRGDLLADPTHHDLVVVAGFLRA